MAPAHLSPWRRMRRSRVPSNGPGRFFAAQFSAGCTTNMSAFDFRQAQGPKCKGLALRASESGDGAQIRTTKDEAADFPRDILKSGPMGVLDIDREAGLFGPDAVIGQSRAFRDARKKIGARSRRDGRVGG